METAARGGFDLRTAQKIVDSFSLSCGIQCRILDERGGCLYTCQSSPDACDFLKALPEAPICQQVHLDGARQAQRFGGRYIYSCAAGLTFFSAPILTGGTLAGALCAGPVLIMDPEDFLEDMVARRHISQGEVPPIRDFLTGLPQIEPFRLSHLAMQLFTNAVYISDSSREILLSLHGSEQQRAIGEYIQQIKSAQDTPYPIGKEQELLAAVSRGDRSVAAALLNELLGHIFFLTRDPDVIQTRIAELLVLLSRAAINSGANADEVLRISHSYAYQFRQLSDQADIAQWLALALNRFMDLIFDLVDSKHKNVILSAMGYIFANCARNLSLSQVAAYVGYSNSHFSRVFKEETGNTFRAYLNEVRIEKAKSMLLSRELSISEVCGLCGFEDQSYFCKTFKKITGTTPDRYRKQFRRIDVEKEYGG